MSTFKAVLLILTTLINVFSYLTGLISKEVYEASLESSKKWVHDATNGPLKDRLQGGKDAENDFNRHAPK